MKLTHHQTDLLLTIINPFSSRREVNGAIRELRAQVMGAEGLQFTPPEPEPVAPSDELLAELYQ
jgi:hypothetical protein